jgi:hypothetical protein
MSPTTDNFIHSLVEMSKAFEELPSVKSELEQAKHENDSYLNMVQQREESILRLKAELEASHEARRKVEAERDDAELRFLELDEKAAKAVDRVRQMAVILGVVDETLSPPKPEPVPEPKAIDNPMYGDPQQGQSEPDPTAPMIETSPSTSAHSAETSTDHVGTSSEGQRVADPTASSTAGDGHSSEIAPVGTVATDAPSPEQPPTTHSTPVGQLQPYAGKRYVDHPVYVMLVDWLAGGGTEADYYAR